MKSTETTAKFGMMTYLLVILAAALILSGVYFFVLTPGQPDGSERPPASETNEGVRP